MRKTLITILCSIMVFASIAQNSKKKYGVGAGISFTDFSGPITDQYFMFERHKSALNLSIGRYLSKSFDGRLNLTYGNIWHPFVTNYPNQIEGLYSPATMWDLGFNIQLKLNNGSLIKEDARFAPYLYTGIGANMINGIGNVGVNDDINSYIPVGVGLNVRLSDNWTAALDLGYKFNLDNSYSYTQSTLKLIKNFGKASTTETVATPAADAPAATSSTEKSAAVATDAPKAAPISDKFCNHKWSIYAGIGFVDFQTPITGQPFMFDRYKSVLNLGVQRYLSKYFDARLNFAYGNVWHPFEVAYPKIDRSLMVPATMYELGMDLMFKFNNGKILKETAIFAPYIYTGIGANMITGIGNVGVSDDVNTNIPVGIGFNFRTSDKFSLNLDAAYKFNLDNSYDYVSTGLRGVYHLGKCGDNAKKEEVTASAVTPKVDDADGDGIPDLTDECPFVAGKTEFFGCPDSDGDAIGDSRDKCPFEAGTAEGQGCPTKTEMDDSDKDGVANNDDLCPDEQGPASNNGCPDASAKPSTETATTVTPTPTPTEQAKPTTSSASTAKPTTTAKPATTKTTTTTTTTPTKSNIKEREVVKYTPPTENTKQNLVNSYTIFFTNGNTIAPGQIETLQAVASMLRNNPNLSVRLNGHTAKGGSSSKNMDLSISRAEKVLSTLKMKGVDMKRTRLVGYGDERSKFSGTESGKNNRVEIEVYSFE